MSRFFLAALLAGIVIVLGIYLARRDSTTLLPGQNKPGPTAPSAQSGARTVAPSAALAPDSRSAGPSNSQAPGVTSSNVAVDRRLPPASVPPLTGEFVNVPPSAIFENMRVSIRLYHSALGENPVGNNAEITAALNGSNPKGTVFLKDDGNRINSRGELVDGWGQPYFFHQLSAHEMEIRSAGPDRVLWTADDLVTK